MVLIWLCRTDDGWDSHECFCGLPMEKSTEITGKSLYNLSCKSHGIVCTTKMYQFQHKEKPKNKLPGCCEILKWMGGE